MRSNFIQMYIHCTWATWDRLPIITPDIQEALYSVIIKECRELKCEPIAIGGVSDHIHLLTGFTSTVTISELMKQIKGSSSHFINHEIKPDNFFKWQGGYGAFTVSHNSLDPLVQYIKNQEQHHRQKSLVPDWEII
jgi:putative transposase